MHAVLLDGGVPDGRAERCHGCADVRSPGPFKAFLDFQTTKTIDVGEVKTLMGRLCEGMHYMRLLSELFDEFNRKIVQKHFKRYPPISLGSHSWRMPITFFTPKDIFMGKRSYLSELYSQVETANA